MHAKRASAAPEDCQYSSLPQCTVTHWRGRTEASAVELVEVAWLYPELGSRTEGFRCVWGFRGGSIGMRIEPPLNQSDAHYFGFARRVSDL